MRLLSRSSRAIRAAVAVASLALFASPTVQAQEDESIYSFSAGLDYTSHFISYGADVWGGGYEISPFSPKSTTFAYATVTGQVADNLALYANIWSDLNDTIDSAIGGPIQEIDFNVGATFTFDKLAFTLAYGHWMYAGDEERVVDFWVSYNDSGMMAEGFALNPSINLHYRVDGNGGQEEAGCLVFGLKPAYTFAPESKFPITLAVPLAVALYEDEFQGGDGGYGYASAGLAVSVPLAFIPAKFGSFATTVSVTYYNTPEDSLPNNAEENFFVSAISTTWAW